MKKDAAGQPGLVWRTMRRLNARMAANYRRGFGPRRVVLLLTTTGRKSGLKRTTPLQYERIDGVFYLGSARGVMADWFRNIQADPCVEIEVNGDKFPALAEAISEPARIADFLGLRLQRHPLMIGLLMRLEGLPIRYSRSDLEHFAAGKAMAIIRPLARTSGSPARN